VIAAALLLPCTCWAQTRVAESVSVNAAKPPEGTAASVNVREAAAEEGVDAARDVVVGEPTRASLSTLSAENRKRLRLPAALWIAGTAADQITTYRFSSQYGDLLHEKNPLLSGLDGHPGLLVAAGTAFDAATGWLVYRFLGPTHPRLAQALFYGAAAYRSYLAIHNTQMMQQAIDVRARLASTPPR
jgi:hypothetical protein